MNFSVFGVPAVQVYQQMMSEWYGSADNFSEAVAVFQKLLTKEPELGPRDWSPRTGKCFCKKD